MMQRQVGKSADDPHTLINGYAKDRGPAHPLANGNSEQQFRFGPGCDVYFEIDKLSRRIVRWRYEGSEQSCVVVP